MRHVISIKQFLDKALLEELLSSAKKFQSLAPADYPKPLEHKIIATLFYEPSTRTRLSFETAVQRLGGNIISTENAGQFSSAAKGETLEDSIRTINGYANAIVLRHPEIGAAERAAAVSDVSIINAGDGAGEHPTQALLDLFTIQSAKGKIDNLKVGLVGDLLNGRTIHSLVQLLAIYKTELFLISPASLQIPEEYLRLLKQHNVPFTIQDNWDESLSQLDVIYMTRVQKERFKQIKDYEAVKDNFILTPALMKRMKKDAIVMHPLPRLKEIDPAIDIDPRAIYFQQATNGLYVRMALLDYIFSN